MPRVGAGAASHLERLCRVRVAQLPAAGEREPGASSRQRRAVLDVPGTVRQVRRAARRDARGGGRGRGQVVGAGGQERLRLPSLLPIGKGPSPPPTLRLSVGENEAQYDVLAETFWKTSQIAGIASRWPEDRGEACGASGPFSKGCR